MDAREHLLGLAVAAAARRRGDACWIRDFRREARDCFAREGLPGRRDEAWKYTRVAPVAKVAWALPPEQPRPAGGEALALGVGPLALVSDGVALGLPDDLPAGVRLVRLDDVAEERGGPAIAHLGRLAGPEGHPFSALNAALGRGGLVLDVAEGAVMDTPIEVLHLPAAADGPPLLTPRLLVRVGAGARASLVEHFAGDDGVHLTAAVTEVEVAAGAQLRHTFVQREPAGAFHVARLRARVGAGGRIACGLVATGAALGRVEMEITLAEEGAHADIAALYAPAGSQSLDVTTFMDHAAPGCTSDQLAKGVLAGASTGAFTGRVLVREGAQQTDARQSNRSLLLSREATADTRPQLEIYADDVRCTHGATVGHLDDDALFYLRARGIGAEEARHLLVRGFAGEVLQRIGEGRLRERLEALWDDREGRLLA